jgi:hypothetical protein
MHIERLEWIFFNSNSIKYVAFAVPRSRSILVILISEKVSVGEIFEMLLCKYWLKSFSGGLLGSIILVLRKVVNFFTE